MVALLEALLIVSEEPILAFGPQLVATLQQAVKHCAPDTPSTPSLYDPTLPPLAHHTDPIREQISESEDGRLGPRYPWLSRHGQMQTLQALWTAYGVPASFAHAQQPFRMGLIWSRSCEGGVLAAAEAYSLEVCRQYSTNAKLGFLGLSSNAKPGSSLMFLAVDGITSDTDILDAAGQLGSVKQLPITASPDPRVTPACMPPISSLTVVRLGGATPDWTGMPYGLHAQQNMLVHTGASIHAASQMLQPAPPHFRRIPGPDDAKCSTLAYISRPTAALHVQWNPIRVRKEIRRRKVPRAPPPSPPAAEGSAIDLEPQERVDVG